ncbi:MAG: YqhA family protein [Alphaproteobacteria bacterium]|nr:YqhA family protein [Alphaproteobacteria bacterium]
MSAKTLFQFLSFFRWLMLVFCFGLALALSAFAYEFALKLWKFALAIPSMDDVDAVLGLLGLVDHALVAGLVVMVMLSTFSSFIENQDDEQGQVSWLSSISFGALKTKLAATITAIGAITLLEHLFQDSALNPVNVGLELAVELVLLLVFVAFAVLDGLASRRPH